MSVLLETSLGDIVVDLYVKEVPLICTNFLKLCKLKYYNDCHVFRVEKGFIAQMGDPENTGRGGASVFAQCYGAQASYFKPERGYQLSHSRRGTLSMTGGTGTDTDGAKGLGSQFFLTLGHDLEYLDGKHFVFGHVAEGWATLNRIEEAFVDEQFRPYRLIRLRHTIVLDDPFADPRGMPDAPASPPPRQGGDGDRLGSEDEEEDSEAGRDGEAREAAREARAARSRAEVLEMIGDIGHADMKPPDNVLFVCKLNAVTEADDLEIIFSRFGECRADIVRDRETGASLCYAFIEYADRAACEKAFFKLDNCLIDDRRVRVDFSQSVSKLWNARRRGERPRFDSREMDNVHDASQGCDYPAGKRKRRWN
jgi:peptidyl-prolyl cis-trans isomerase-like 4